MLLITAIAVSCVGIGLFWQISGDSDEKQTSYTHPTRKAIDDAQSIEDQVDVKSMRRRATKKVTRLREKPQMVEIADEEMDELTDLARKLLVSLQAALDAEDLKQIQSIIAMIENSPKGVLSKKANGIPVYMRRKIVEAVGWFGSSGMPEIVDFLGDENPEVVEAAMAQFELALEDVSLGDRARAEIVVMASKALHDSDALERIFMEISNMRNSVAAQTLVDVCQFGTDEAKAFMPETIEFITGEDNIVTVDDLQHWLDNNPDGPDDEDLYGPMDLGDDE